MYYLVKFDYGNKTFHRLEQLSVELNSDDDPEVLKNEIHEFIKGHVKELKEIYGQHKVVNICLYKSENEKKVEDYTNLDMFMAFDDLG